MLEEVKSNSYSNYECEYKEPGKREGGTNERGLKTKARHMIQNYDDATKYGV